MKRYFLIATCLLTFGILKADQSLNQLTQVSTMTATDLLYKMESPGSGNNDRSISYSDLNTNLNASLVISSVAVNTVGSAQMKSVVGSGSCTNCNATINAQGQVTGFSNGSSGGGGGGSLAVAQNGSVTGTAISTMNFESSMVVSVNGSSASVRVNFSSVTAQGNIFNGASELVQLNSSSQLPAISATNLTNVPAAQLTGIVPNSSIDGSSITKQGLFSASTNITFTPVSGGIAISATGGGGGSGTTIFFQQAGSGVVTSSTLNAVVPLNMTNVGGVATIGVQSSSVTLQGPIVSSITISAMYGAPTLVGTNFTSIPGAQVTSGVPAANIAAGSLGSSVLVSSLTAVVAPGTYGSTTISPTITINAQGQVIALSSNTIAGGGGGSGYAIQPATVTIQANQGLSTTWLTVTTSATIPVQVNAISSDTIANVAGSSVTFNLASTDWHYVQLSTNTPAGLLITNPSVGQEFTIMLQQPGGGTGTLVNWFSGIKWPGGVVPTLTVGNAKTDVFTFKTFSSGVYYGYIVGENQ